MAVTQVCHAAKTQDRCATFAYGNAMNRQILIGYLYAASGAALFSTKAIFIKLAYMDKVDAALMLALRMMTAAPFFLTVAIFTMWRRWSTGQPLPPLKAWIAAAALGLFGFYVSAWFDFAGLQYITAQLERLLLFTYPVMVMVLGALFFGQHIGIRGVIGALVTYAGLGVVFLTAREIGGSNLYLGVGLVLACAFIFALQQLFSKSVIKDMGSILFTCVVMISATPACMAHYVIQSGDYYFIATTRFYWLAAGCGFFATVLPGFLMNASLAKVSAQSTSMIASISPVITIVLAVWVLGEQFTWNDAVGAAMVIIGIFIFATDNKKQAAPKETLAEMETV